MTTLDSKYNYTWDEGGVYLGWTPIEKMRHTLLDYIELLTSSYSNQADIDVEYLDRKLADARLLLKKLGGY